MSELLEYKVSYLGIELVSCLSTESASYLSQRVT